MRRSVQVRDEPAGPWPINQGACSFCMVPAQAPPHDLCPGEIKNAAGKQGSVWTCACYAAGHDVSARIEEPVTRKERS